MDGLAVARFGAALLASLVVTHILLHWARESRAASSSVPH